MSPQELERAKQYAGQLAEETAMKLDDRYEALSPSVTDLLAKFIRQHSAAFAENA